MQAYTWVAKMSTTAPALWDTESKEAFKIKYVELRVAAAEVAAAEAVAAEAAALKIKQDEDTI